MCDKRVPISDNLLLLFTTNDEMMDNNEKKESRFENYLRFYVDLFTLFRQ